MKEFIIKGLILGLIIGLLIGFSGGYAYKNYTADDGGMGQDPLNDLITQVILGDKYDYTNGNKIVKYKDTAVTPWYAEPINGCPNNYRAENMRWPFYKTQLAESLDYTTAQEKDAPAHHMLPNPKAGEFLVQGYDHVFVEAYPDDPNRPGKHLFVARLSTKKERGITAPKQWYKQNAGQFGIPNVFPGIGGNKKPAFYLGDDVVGTLERGNLVSVVDSAGNPIDKLLCVEI